MEMVQIRINQGPSFARTLRLVKESQGARYDGTTQTWSIPSNHRILSNGINRSQYRFEVVGQTNPDTYNANKGRCTLYVATEGCPLHGEYCKEMGF